MKKFKTILLSGYILVALCSACQKEQVQTAKTSRKQQVVQGGLSLLGVQDTLRVMTFNMLRGYDRNGVYKLPDISDLIELSGADIIFLQEVDKNTVQSGNVDQMLYLKNNTAGMVDYKFAKHYDYDGGEFGVGILSKFPLSDVKNNRLPYAPGTGDPSIASTAPDRALLTARVTLPNGRNIAVASIHFSGSDANITDQATATVGFLKYYNNVPVVIGGDMNSEYTSTPVTTLTNYYQDTENRYLTNPIGDFYTFPAHNTTNPLKKIDYIMVSKPHLNQVLYRNVIKVPNVTRDHYSYVTQIEFKPQLFTAGNLVVERYGDGSGALSTATTKIFLDEYTPTGTFVRTIAVPFAASGLNKAFTGIGTSTNEGLMTLSQNKQHLSLIGYEAAPGATISNQDRLIGVVTPDGEMNTSTTIDAASGIGGARCVVSVDGSGFWTASSTGNIRYTLMGSTGASVDMGAPSGSRSLYLYNFSGNDRLYVSTTISGTRLARIGTGTSLPKTGPQTLTNFPGYPTSSTAPNQFVMFDTDGNSTPDIFYVADDGAGTILKYIYNTGTSQWDAQGSVSVAGIKSITGTIASGTVTLYFTTTGSPSTLKKLSNSATSTLTGASVTNLVTAGTNKIFKSVAFAPTY